MLLLLPIGKDPSLYALSFAWDGLSHSGAPQLTLRLWHFSLWTAPPGDEKVVSLSVLKQQLEAEMMVVRSATEHTDPDLHPTKQTARVLLIAVTWKFLASLCLTLFGKIPMQGVNELFKTSEIFLPLQKLMQHL